MKTASWQYYDSNAKQFFRDYETLNFAKTHRAFLPYLPRQSTNCLDVGGGSGRDAKALAKRGYKVTAVEPSDALRHLATIRHSHPNIQWIQDHLPQLTQVNALKRKFEFILLSAVWMHIHPNERGAPWHHCLHY